MADYECDRCDFATHHGAALASHIRWKHPVEVGLDGPNVAAARATLAELKRMGRVEDIDAARRQALISLAETVDQRPDNPGLWREYRAAIDDLLRTDDDADDELAAALAEIAGGSEVGNQAPS